MALKRKRIVVLASGRGSNFAALADAVSSGEIPGSDITALICNNKKALAIQRAEERGIPVYVVNSKSFIEAGKFAGKFDRAAYEITLLEVLKSLSPDYICLAGYMLLLGKQFVQMWPNQIINIHPSLLPAFKGLHAQQQALDAGAKETGCTVHFVTEELDAGPVITQSKIEILPNDTEESLSDRLRPLEHMTYIEALRKLCGS